MTFFKHVLSLRIYLRYLQASLLGSRADELLHLVIELVNSTSEKEYQEYGANQGISSKISSSTQ